MSNYIKRIELAINSNNLAVQTAIGNELLNIDSLQCTVKDVKEYINIGKDLLVIDIEYYFDIYKNSIAVWDSDNYNEVGDILTVNDFKKNDNVANTLLANKPNVIINDVDFNGYNSFIFDGVNDMLQKAVTNWRNNDSSGSFYFVFKTGSDITSFQPLSASVEGTTTSNRLELIILNGKFYFQLVGAAVINIVYGGTLAINTKFLVKFESTGTGYNLTINNVSEALTASTGFKDGKWLSAIAGTRNSLEIGSRIIPGFKRYFNGKIAFVGYYPYLLPNNDLTVQNELTQKYNIV